MFPQVGMHDRNEGRALLSLVLNSDKSVQAASASWGHALLLPGCTELPCVGSEVPTAGLMLKLPPTSPLVDTVGLCFPSLHLTMINANTDIKRAVCQAHVR